MNDTVYYHEDYYRQIELIPEKNYFKTLNDIDNIPLVPNDQYGYTISIQRDEHLIKTESLKIPLLEINDLLFPLSLNFFQEVKTGYSNQHKIKKNTIAFGFERLGIFIESDAGMVVNIWLCLSPEFKQSQSADNLLNALHSIGGKYGLVLIDWDEKSVICLSFIQSIKNYLQEAFGFIFIN